MPTPIPYLRVVVTRACPLRCTYCHAEGDRGDAASAASGDERAAIVAAGVRAGIRKIKLLGGEPLASGDTVKVVRAAKASGAADVSVITSGVAPRSRIEALFDAGLDRANLSLHGWSPQAFARRGGSDRARALRAETMAAILARGRKMKVNYVFGGPDDLADLAEVLAWAAGQPVVVGVLDDLTKDLGPSAVLAAVRALRGPERSIAVDHDPDSLDTLHLTWADGLVVEVKHQSLGAIAPWSACRACPARARCKEGIRAVRLDADAVLRPCMDRPDLGLPLLPILRQQGPEAVTAAWAAWVGKEAR